MRVWPATMAWMMSLAACSSPGPASQPGAIGCSDCDIELQTVAQITDAFEPGALPDRMVYADGDSRGRVFTISRSADQVLVLGDSGQVLARIGKPGEGPGEFRHIRRALLGPGDSLFVVDWGTSRVTVYGPGLTLARIQRVSHYPSLVLPDSRFVVATGIASPVATGYPMLLIGNDGEVARSFGAPITRPSPEIERDRPRHLAVAQDGGIWAVSRGRYTLDRWDPASGELKQRVEVGSSRVRNWAEYPEDERVRPTASIETLWEDADGLVWLLIRDADEQWVAPSRANQERLVSDEEYDATFDWVIEVVDPATGKVIASRRFGRVLWGRPTSGLLVARTDSLPEGLSGFIVVRPKLVSR